MCVEGKNFYHAGDLNWWHWEEETELYNENMKKSYGKEIDRLEGKHFNAAFVPLDPRQGEAYRYGMDYFLAKASADYVFPMHMWEQYDWIQKYKNALMQENDSKYDECHMANENSMACKCKNCIMEIKHAFTQFFIA